MEDKRLFIKLYLAKTSQVKRSINKINILNNITITFIILVYANFECSIRKSLKSLLNLKKT